MRHVLLLTALTSCLIAAPPQVAWAARPKVGKVTAKSRLFANLEQGMPQTIVTYGTSLTAGGAWVTQLQEALNSSFPKLATVVNSGESGQWSKWGVENLEQRVIQKKPDTVFIEFSINDAYLPYETSVEAAQAYLEDMIERILKANAQCEIILMVMNPPIGPHLEKRPNILAYNQMVRDVAKQRGLRLIDHFPHWEKLLNEDKKTFDQWVPDGIHPSAEGCLQVIMPTMLTMLENAPSSTSKPQKQPKQKNTKKKKVAAETNRRD